ncbi:MULTISPECIES: hypothetical protein [Terrisporobacter]|uniref:Uncharacterized protein n=1 Tax=Terrisporobacter othiniensis TaxID=1577792 RepID=A0A0B3VSU3_9FIRM|nr:MULTISPECIES: hypothetical protein [Terrisporobacter]KHS55689.1 hypothetical protein QX51_18060 [Terrisporobacter othiniensis]MCC3668868.1 hypothetical protein [Terrisporobacter mayombei]
MKINKEMYFLNITKICVAIKNKNILTAKESKKIAESMGFYKIKQTSHGQPIFYNKKKRNIYIQI